MDLLQCFINVLIKKTSDGLVQNEIISNKELAGESQKPIIRKLNKRKAHSHFISNIWGADLAEMQLVSKFNKGSRFLLCVIDIYTKYTWVIPLKHKKGITITNPFPKHLQESKCELNKIWVDRGNEFCKKSMK